VAEDGLPSLAAACLHLTIGAAQLGSTAPSLSDVCCALGCSSSEEPAQMTLQLKQQLKDDTSAMSVSTLSAGSSIHCITASAMLLVL